MSQSKINHEEVIVQQKVYDHLFIAIFGKDSERSKRWRLELYNALNNTNYTDPNALELNTLENVIYIKMHNDVSFLIDSQMTLYEHQRTTNPNMPLRGLFYFAKVLNVNREYNLPLQKKCKPLYDYIQFTSRINDNKTKGMPIETAVDEAVDWACEQNLLEGYIREQKAEVKMNLLTEYDEEAYIRIWRRDGIMEGRQEKAVEAAVMLIHEYKETPEVAAKKMNAPLELVLKALKK